MTDLIRYELPRVVVKASRKYLGDERLLFENVTTIVTEPVSPGGQVWPVGLEIDADVAPRLMVYDVKVGRNSQLVSCGCVPATLFALPTPVDLRLDKLSSGERLSLQVSCAGPEDVTFKGRILAAGPTTPVPGRTLVVGFGFTEVGAGKSVALVVRPQVEVRLTRLHVPPHLTDAFRIDDLFHGPYLDVEKVSRVADTRQLDRENLSRGGEVALTPTPDVGVGCPVALRVTNVSSTTQYFSAALLGESVERTCGSGEDKWVGGIQS